MNSYLGQGSLKAITSVKSRRFTFPNSNETFPPIFDLILEFLDKMKEIFILSLSKSYSVLKVIKMVKSRFLRL